MNIIRPVTHAEFDVESKVVWTSEVVRVTIVTDIVGVTVLGIEVETSVTTITTET